MSENNKPGKLKLKKNYFEKPAQDESIVSANEGEDSSTTPATPFTFQRKHDKSNSFRQNMRFVAGWLLFIILGGALTYFRFFSNIPGLAPDLYKQYGLIAIGVIYVISIFLALRDNMFAGLLAIVVPFYPIYYIFSWCGSVLFRAVCAALLVAFGYDFLLLVQSFALIIFDKVSYWIQNVNA